jgi:hypothetical protein
MSILSLLSSFSKANINPPSSLDNVYEIGINVYLNIISKDPNQSDELILQLMSDKKIPANLSWEIIGLVPIYAGRVVLDGLGIDFSKKYNVLNSDK